MKLDRSTQPVVYRTMAIPRSEFEARLAKEERRDQRFKLAVSIGFLVYIIVAIFIGGGI